MIATAKVASLWRPLTSDRLAAPHAIAIVRWLFYGFVFSLPFETVGKGMLEPPTIMGALLLVGLLLQPGLLLRWPPKGFWCFVAFLYLFAVLAVLEPQKYRALMIHDVVLLAQLTLLCWIGYNLMREERIARQALLALAFGCALLAILQISGMATSAVEPDEPVVRLTAFGFHPNNLARILSLGLLALVGLAMMRGRMSWRSALVAIPLAIVIALALIQTGSRGGLIALGAGLITLMLGGATLREKLRNLGILLIALIFLSIATWQSEVMSSRFENTLEEGDLARRELIYPNSWEMIKEKPFAGWGPISGSYELGRRLAHPEELTKNPHNLIFYALIATGVVGTVPLLAGVGVALGSAWKARRKAHRLLPAAMIVSVLVANMSSLWLFNKLHWLVMAYALASIHFAKHARQLGTRTASTI